MVQLIISCLWTKLYICPCSWHVHPVRPYSSCSNSPIQAFFILMHTCVKLFMPMNSFSVGNNTIFCAYTHIFDIGTLKYRSHVSHQICEYIHCRILCQLTCKMILNCACCGWPNPIHHYSCLLCHNKEICTSKSLSVIWLAQYVHLFLHLQLKVSGKNLLNICKLIFKISRSENNDRLFQNDDLMGEIIYSSFNATPDFILPYFAH